MTHRAGHLEDSGDDIYSMDRRKYLSTLAAGAAFGAVAVGAAACGPGGGDHTTRELELFSLKVPDIAGKNLWGYLRVFPPEITRVVDAKTEQLVGIKTIRIPFFNNTGLDLSRSPVLGFHLLTIGCPGKFAMAINLTRDDHHPDDMPPRDQIEKRHREMDAALLAMGYVEEVWTGIETTPCPPSK